MKKWQKVLSIFLLVIALGIVITIPNSEAQANITSHSNFVECQDGSRCTGGIVRAGSIATAPATERIHVQARLYSNHATGLVLQSTSNVFSGSINVAARTNFFLVLSATSRGSSWTGW